LRLRWATRSGKRCANGGAASELNEAKIHSLPHCSQLSARPYGGARRGLRCGSEGVRQRRRTVAADGVLDKGQDNKTVDARLTGEVRWSQVRTCGGFTALGQVRRGVPLCTLSPRLVLAGERHGDLRW